MVTTLADAPSSISAYLEVLKQHSILAMLGSLLGEHLHLVTDLEFVSAVFSFFISLSNSCKSVSVQLQECKCEASVKGALN